ncbi:MAG TPA: hypothetical protein VL634_20765 [Mycobacterium sp.]|nr:hypothetical protein [Mycobacterium sp.]
MEVVFRRLSHRQYGIGLIRDGARDVGENVAMRVAPGDSRVPHDLVHFVVEEQAGLKLGIFGQCAAGGDVGGFFRASGGKRGKTRQAKRSRRLGGAGRSDVGRSEELAGMARDGSIPAEVPPAEVLPELRNAINTRLDEVLARWNAVPVGGDLVLPWPVRLTVKRGQI